MVKLWRYIYSALLLQIALMLSYPKHIENGSSSLTHARRCLSVSLPLFLSPFIYLSLSLYQSTYLSIIDLSIYICLYSHSQYLSLHPFVCLTVCLFVPAHNCIDFVISY